MKKCLMLIAMASVVLSCTTRTIDEEKMMNKIRGGWVGKVIGVQYGQPYEFWYLGRPNDGELNWDPACVEGALGQDDIYTQMSFMQTFDTYGLDATPKQLGDAFANAGFSLCHANLQGRKNIFDGIAPPLSGSAKYNAHADDIDFQIDADFIGFMNPGMPHAAYEYCDRIGHIMNDGDGFYGGVFVASMHTLAFFDDNIPRIVEKANVIRPSTRSGRPMTGIIENAMLVSSPPFPERPSIEGYLIMQDTSTRPVIRQITTVSQNVPVIDTSA